MEKLTKRELKEQRKLEKLQYQKQLDSQGRKKTLLLWVGLPLVILLSVFGLIKLAGSSSSPSSDVPNITLQTPVSANDLQTGSKDAKAVIVEYADFQCPGCGAEHPILKQIVSDYKDKVLFVYRFFPLTQIHQNAMLAAQAGYAANLQGKFWEMHDLLFENQQKWATDPSAIDTFMAFAKKLDLDTDKFKNDMNADSTKKFIADEENAGTANGVNSTPTIFFNNKMITSPTGALPTYDDLKKLADTALKSGK
ncbi:MAG TPA: thioredoxin domain-containing protein [Candidatus Saccharimonadales bacterium]|nr:thioredoxin domain-containing protein [Candidatus Saccharimonadales bacterium]